MKTNKYSIKLLIFFIGFLFSLDVASQVSVTESSGNVKQKNESELSDDLANTTFQNVEIEATVAGGIANWRRYLQNNVNSNVPIDNNAPVGTYTVIVRFIVSKTGDISDIVAETKHGYGMEQEAIRVIKNGPKWKPGSQKGVLVNSVRRQPITFIVNKTPSANLKKQNEVKHPDDFAEVIYTDVDKPAEYEGGILNWEAFIRRNLDADLPTKKNAPKEGYKVIVKFVIKKDGTVGEVVVETKEGYGMEEEAIRVIKMSPKWIPAIKDGRNVDVYQRQAIAFYVSKNPEREKTGEELLNPKVPPSFPGTIVDWRNYLRNNLDEQVPYFNSAPRGRYKVLIEFTVDVDGTVSDVTAKTNHGYGMEKEAKRVIKNSPKWNPGKINGQPVKSSHVQPFTFIVTED